MHVLGQAILQDHAFLQKVCVNSPLKQSLMLAAVASFRMRAGQSSKLNSSSSSASKLHEMADSLLDGLVVNS